MIPVRLAIRNFMSYTDIHEPLIFDGIHVACLSGENGAGKSTLLDAVTWALWGRSRAPTTDQLVHAGSTDMEVELEFVLGDQQYRVVRKRAVRGNRGSTVLDLSVRDGEGYRSISEDSVPETERKIEGLLRMSYSTFINSSFILQGKADSFTTSTPTERKQVLADILELSEYDRLQERARREVSERDHRQSAIVTWLRETDAELERRAERVEAKERLEAELAEVEGQVQRQAADLEKLQERLAELAALERQLAEAVEQERHTEEAIGQHQREIGEIEHELGGMRNLLDREREIEKQYAEFVAARETNEKLNATLAEWARLCEDRNGLDRRVATARGRLETELAGLEQRLAQLEADAARLREGEQEERRARQELEELERLQQRKAGLERDLAAAREREAELRGANQRLRGEMDQLRAKIDALEGAAICPICRSALDEAGRGALIGRYTAEGKAQRVEYEQNLAETRRLQGESEQLDADLQRIVAEVGQLLGVQRRLAAAEQMVQRGRKAGQEAQVARIDQAKLREALESGDFARAELQALEELRRRLDGLGYDEAAHRRVQKELEGLLGYEPLKRNLDSARQAIALKEQMLAQSRRGLEGWQRRREQERRRVEALREATRGLPELRGRVGEAQQSLQEARRRQGTLSGELGEARQHLSYLDRLEQQKKERLEEMDQLVRQKTLYRELADALGKNGVQAMIIETAIPEIEDEANRLLGGMTEGRMHVKLETQRDRRVGEGTIETLDIVINDELGARAYEMYSGGEAFRVNFAIRIALSKLLARRAGARLQTLVIDEGFGSQDDEGRERLVEAIQSVALQFAMILVITHLEDLRDRFPVRIDVRKTALGSVTSVEWVA